MVDRQTEREHGEVDVLVLSDGQGGYVVVPGTVLESLRLTSDHLGELGEALRSAGEEAESVLPDRGWTLIGWGRARYEPPPAARGRTEAAFEAMLDQDRIYGIFVIED
jgi:hypothetical protein